MLFVLLLSGKFYLLFATAVLMPGIGFRHCGTHFPARQTENEGVMPLQVCVAKFLLVST